MDKMRSGITLLITLSVIATMVALMGVMFKYLDVARTKAEVKASLIQSNLLKEDMVNLLDRVLGKKPSKDTMNRLFTTPLAFGATNGEFSFSVGCSPLANRLNIAWLSSREVGKTQKKYDLAVNTFETLCEKANSRNPSDLLDAIVQELESGVSTTLVRQVELQKKRV